MGEGAGGAGVDDAVAGVGQGLVDVAEEYAHLRAAPSPAGAADQELTKRRDGQALRPAPSRLRPCRQYVGVTYHLFDQMNGLAQVGTAAT